MYVRSPRRGRASQWLLGLDGLRGLAVTAVVAFHFAPTALPGGFLGVDLFFVISGYLITRLLLVEINSTGGIRARHFYVRRARRLLPAVITLLLVTTVASVLIWRDEVPNLPGGVLASLGYVTNWWLIGDHQSYFVATGRPPMVQHLWSLAIEEQFYLLWPLALALSAGAHLTWRRGGAARAGGPTTLTPARLYRVVGLATALALGSTLAMAVIAVGTDVPYHADSGRVYFGTDTHAMGLLLGAAAGALAARGRLLAVRQRLPRGTLLTDAAALLALLGLALIVTRVNEFTPWLYRGGFLAASALGAVVVAAAPRRTSLLGRLLDHQPLRWLGQRSYSIYLWHWPVAVVTRPDIDLAASGWPVLLLRTAITLGLAEASYRFIERPLRVAHPHPIRPAPALPRPAQSTRNSMQWIALTAAAILAAPPVLANAPATTPHPPPAAAPRATQPPPVPPAQPTPAKVSAFGDSVMRNAAPALAAAIPHLSVSAIEGRQAREVFADITRQRAAGTLGPTVVIQTGNNGIIAPDDLSATLASLSDRKRVIVVTDHVPRDWEGPNNDILHATVGHFRNVILVDWHNLADHHQDWFWDGIHMRPSGARAYAAAIAAGLNNPPG
ncbi:MAG TPA: acyltransferase family protein [Pseudonocardia sp.]|jgi:peptidoglycan/LPS O-acetylase OafA/YrhL